MKFLSSFLLAQRQWRRSHPSIKNSRQYIMPPKKKIKLIEAHAVDAEGATVDHLSDDTVALIFSYFGPVEIMQMRCVCKKWREASKKTIPARVNFHVDSVNKFCAMVVMTRALPNIQEIMLRDLNYGTRQGSRDRCADGEDPCDYPHPHAEVMHDINIISNFSKLRSLRLVCGADLNGRYPVLFDFPLLQKLNISACSLKWDLEMLRGLPLLKELFCYGVPHMTGDIKSFRMLKDNIEDSNC